MKRFIEGEDRNQSTLFPECLDDYIAEDNPVRVVDVFVDELDIAQLGFQRVEPKETGRPAYHPSMLLKLYIYAYLNRVQSSRRIEREAQRNVELMWSVDRAAVTRPQDDLGLSQGQQPGDSWCMSQVCCPVPASEPLYPGTGSH